MGFLFLLHSEQTTPVCEKETVKQFKINTRSWKQRTSLLMKHNHDEQDLKGGFEAHTEKVIKKEVKDLRKF